MYEMALTKVAAFVRLLETGEAINDRLKSIANVRTKSLSQKAQK